MNAVYCDEFREMDIHPNSMCSQPSRYPFSAELISWNVCVLRWVLQPGKDLWATERLDLKPCALLVQRVRAPLFLLNFVFRRPVA